MKTVKINLVLNILAIAFIVITAYKGTWSSLIFDLPYMFAVWVWVDMKNRLVLFATLFFNGLLAFIGLFYLFTVSTGMLHLDYVSKMQVLLFSGILFSALPLFNVWVIRKRILKY